MGLFLRTQDFRFKSLKDYNFQPNYITISDKEIGVLRIHYVDEGKKTDPAIILLHGEPSWSYLYRHMIPILSNNGFRVVAPDLIGFGKSDKPKDRNSYTYKSHVTWLTLFLNQLKIKNSVLFGQDWGGLIGLRILAESPNFFNKVMIGNTAFHTLFENLGSEFYKRRNYSQNSETFKIGNVIHRGTFKGLSGEEINAYDAPFPDEEYKSGARQFPLLVPDSIDDPAHHDQKKAWGKLIKLRKPILTCFSDKDPIMRGLEKVFIKNIPGAAGQDHFITKNAGHFFQEDEGIFLAGRLIKFAKN